MRAAFVLIAAALLAAPFPARAATERVKTAVQTDRASARLVLEWQRPVDYTVTQNGAYIFVRFSRPFAGAIDQARAPLARYLAEFRLAGGARVLVMRQVGEPRFVHQRRGNSVVLTWIGADRLQPSRAERAARTAPRRAKSSTADNPTDSDDAPTTHGPTRAGSTPGPVPRVAAPGGPTPKTPSVARHEQPKRPAAPPELHAANPSSPKASGAALKTPVAANEKTPARPAPPPGSPNGHVAKSPGADAETPPRPSVPYTEAQIPPARPIVPPSARTARPSGPVPEGAAANDPKPPSSTADAPVPPARPVTPPPSRAEPPKPPGSMADAKIPPARPVAPPLSRAERPPGPLPEGVVANGPSPRTPEAKADKPPRTAVPYTDALIPPARPVAPPAVRTERPSGPVPESVAPNGLAPKQPGAEADALPPRPAAPPETRVERPALPPTLVAPPPAPASPRGEEAKPAPHVAKAPDATPPAKPDIRPAPVARPAPDGPIEPPVMPAISPILTVSSAGAETRLVLAWPEPVGAAVFRHGDYIWMVFPRREAFDLQVYQRLLGPGVEKLARVEHSQATILVARARADVRARVTHERNVWTIVLKRENGAPALPDVRLAISRGVAEQVAVPVPGAESPVRIVTPEIGAILHAVPSRANAASAGERGFVTFRILPAVQGGVVEALADGITVGAEGGAMTIRRNGGLLLSNGGPPGSTHGQ